MKNKKPKKGTPEYREYLKERKYKRALQQESWLVRKLIAEEEQVEFNEPCPKEALKPPKKKKKKNRDNYKCGIYRLYNKTNNKSYIGQSINIDSRKSQHFSKLRLGAHQKKELQEDFNSLGQDNFDFEILELCSKNELEDKEIKWHNVFKKTGLYSNFSKWMNIPFDKIKEVRALLGSNQHN